MALSVLHRSYQSERPDRIHWTGELRLYHGKSFEPRMVPETKGDFTCCRRRRRGTNRTEKVPVRAAEHPENRPEAFAAVERTEGPNDGAAQAETEIGTLELGFGVFTDVEYQPPLELEKLILLYRF